MTLAVTPRHPRPADPADYLEQQLGWESVYAYNSEISGQKAFGPGSDREVVLTRILRQKLAELNPGLPGAATTTLCARSPPPSPPRLSHH